MNIVEKIIEYEQGELPDEEFLPFFQELINTGVIWNLQGHYQRQAMALIQGNHCTVPAQNKSLEKH